MSCKVGEGQRAVDLTPLGISVLASSTYLICKLRKGCATRESVENRYVRHHTDSCQKTHSYIHTPSMAPCHFLWPNYKLSVSLRLCSSSFSVCHTLKLTNCIDFGSRVFVKGLKCGSTGPMSASSLGEQRGNMGSYIHLVAEWFSFCDPLEWRTGSYHYTGFTHDKFVDIFMAQVEKVLQKLCPSVHTLYGHLQLWCF